METDQGILPPGRGDRETGAGQIRRSAADGRVQLFAAEYNLDKSEKSRAAATKDAVFPIRTQRSSEPRSQGIRPPLPIPRKSARNGNMSASTGLCGRTSDTDKAPIRGCMTKQVTPRPCPQTIRPRRIPRKRFQRKKSRFLRSGKTGNIFIFAVFYLTLESKFLEKRRYEQISRGRPCARLPLHDAGRSASDACRPERAAARSSISTPKTTLRAVRSRPGA